MSKTLLFNKEGNKDFDVTMVSFDCTEICELVGFYILYVLSTKYGRNHNGLHRNDMLACFENVCNPKADRIRK